MKRATGVVRVEFGSPEVARAVVEALRVDDAQFIRSRLEGSALVAEAEAASPGSLLHTLDDYLACLTAAEKAARAGRT